VLVRGTSASSSISSLDNTNAYNSIISTDMQRNDENANPRNANQSSSSNSRTAAHLLENCAKSKFLQERGNSLLDYNELYDVECLLLNTDNTSAETFVSYEEFLLLKEKVPRKAKKYFTATNFLSLQPSPSGKISLTTFFQQLCTSTSKSRIRIQLNFFSPSSRYLSESDLDSYINHMIPSLPMLINLHHDFIRFYIHTATRRFMFFLDSNKTGYISINKIINSTVLGELLELGVKDEKYLASSASSPSNLSALGKNRTDSSSSSDPNTGTANTSSFSISQAHSTIRNTNWFSAETSLSVYSTYLSLDVDRNGLLSKQELLAYNGIISYNGVIKGNKCKLTKTFVDQMYQELPMFLISDTSMGGSREDISDNSDREDRGGERGSSHQMDYKRFLDFVLAMENKKTFEGMKYFFRLLDINKCGYLDSFTLSYFFRDIQAILADNGFEVARYEDVRDEIFDMVKPKHPTRITMDDLMACGCGDVVIENLIDINRFWEYEHREQLVWDDEEEIAEGGGGGEGGRSEGGREDVSKEGEDVGLTGVA
jgi:Ca2+-binding EF-hand superfamily protein